MIRGPRKDDKFEIKSNVPSLFRLKHRDLKRIPFL